MDSNYKCVQHYSPVADPPVSVTCTVNCVDDGLLRTSTGCAGPAFSLTLYAGCSNITVKPVEEYQYLC